MTTNFISNKLYFDNVSQINRYSIEYQRDSNFSQFDKLNKRGEFLERIEELSRLKDNWDGYDAASIDAHIVSITRNFILNIKYNFIKHLDKEDIIPTNYGTIIIEWYYQSKVVISLEIANNGKAFFAKFKDETIICDSNKSIDFEKQLNFALNKYNDLFKDDDIEVLEQIKRVQVQLYHVNIQ
jgi:hypothetical protein